MKQVILKKIEENNNRENLIYNAGKYKYGFQQNETTRSFGETIWIWIKTIQIWIKKKYS